MGRQNMTPLSLESIAFMALIRNKKIPTPTRQTLVAPLMIQWMNLLNIVGDYRVMFTTINIMHASGMQTYVGELMERVKHQAELLPRCFESVVVRWSLDPIELWAPELIEQWTYEPIGVAGGIEIITSDDATIFFGWNVGYNYSYGYGGYFTRVYYKDGKVIKEKWFDENFCIKNPYLQRLPAAEPWLLSRNTISLSGDGALIWHITKYIRGGLGQEDLIMSWTAKAYRVTG